MKYVQNCVATLLPCMIILFFVMSHTTSIANTRASADGFLKQLLGAEHYGMGGSFVGATRGANALGSNPAGIGETEGNRFVIHATRFPHTIALLSKPNLNANYEDYSRYEHGSSGVETLNWAFPVGKFGTFGLALALEQGGAFRRVNHLGKALNSFPENNLAIGLSYGVKIFGGTIVGVDTKWLRSKAVGIDGNEDLGHGYAYNVGFIQQIGKAIQIGAVVQNLSNGLSFSDPSIPDIMERTIVAGIAYEREISDMALRFGIDAHPPFRDGVRVNMGAEAWYRYRIGIRIGYLRDTQKRYTSVYLLQNTSFETEERLWKAEGFCFGIGFRFGNIMLNAAYTPQFTPVVADEERIHIVQGNAVYAFSIGQTF
ncbi:MAG: hypothetical protein OXD49_15285 [Candidatus Poribacteria bacterium]|nr:hypothetical protein [Candidatus Poribacteria bacterium]